LRPAARWTKLASGAESDLTALETAEVEGMKAEAQVRAATEHATCIPSTGVREGEGRAVSLGFSSLFGTCRLRCELSL
jgi:hypothetical protein